MFKVGQKLWLVPSERRNSPHWVTIGKVGRKWLTLDGPSSDMRVCQTTLGVFAGNGERTFGIGRVYLDHEEWRRAVDAEEAFSRLRQDISNSYTDRNRKGLTARQIELIRQFLFTPDSRHTTASELFTTTT